MVSAQLIADPYRSHMLIWYCVRESVGKGLLYDRYFLHHSFPWAPLIQETAQEAKDFGIVDGILERRPTSDSTSL